MKKVAQNLLVGFWSYVLYIAAAGIKNGYPPDFTMLSIFFTASAALGLFIFFGERGQEQKNFH